LLRRTTFGPTINDINTFAALTPAAALSRLYRPVTPIPDAPAPVDPDNNNDPWVLTGNTAPDKMEFEYQEHFRQWFIGQMMSAGVPAAQSLAYSAREKLVFFIHTHLTAITEKVGSSRALYYQNQLFRLYALDDVASPVVPAEKLNFKELTKKVSVDNAMLRLLDGNLNVKGNPNENYARELLELYTIGRGLEVEPTETFEEGEYQNYTEIDIKQAAKVLSGFDFDETFNTIDPDTNLPRGIVRGSAQNASGHDNSVKQFSNRFADQQVIPDPLLLSGTQPTEESALDEISQLIDMIYAQPETAIHICRKIYRFFMYHEITQPLQDDIIASMATIFRTNDFKLQPVIEALLTSTHFYNNLLAQPDEYIDDAFGGIIKSPLDLIIGTHRFFGNQFPDMSTNANEFYDQAGEIIRLVKNMGMDFYQPFDVAGYDAYHQYPIYHRSWITVNNLTNRYNFINQLLPNLQLFQFVKSNINSGQASVARNLVIELATFLLPVTENLTFDTSGDETQKATLTAERLLYFLNRFMGMLTVDPETVWAANYATGPDGNMERQLQDLFNAMLQSPEYQLH
jgi:uncharacterized protein (DUF1800 family)